MNDLRFPFGNPYKEKLESHAMKTALKNVVKLAKDKLRIVNGEPEELLLVPESTETLNANMSIEQIENLINYIDSSDSD